MFFTTLGYFFEMIFLFVILLMTAQAIFNIRLRLFIWETPQQAWLNHAPSNYLKPQLSFSILLPARHEERVYRETIEKVNNLHYPKELLQIIAICREDDPGTIAEARKTIDELGEPNIQLLVFNDEPINKPHGLNLGLQIAYGDIVTIFDAEDEPHPEILNIINTTMLNDDMDVVQSGVQLMNHNTKWYCFLNVLEYFFWFKSSMHFFAQIGMIPLGGNTVFVRREVLEHLGGWDEHCLTEDADLGLRLSIRQARIRIIYDDEYVTREETPVTMGQFVKQRTRWNQGFLQILFKREWLQLEKLSQRLLACYVLILPLLQAAFVIMIPISLVMFFLVKLPLWLAMLTFLPFYCFVLGLLIDLAGLHEFLKAHNRKWRWSEAIITMLAFIPYQWILCFGALRATYRFIRGATDWEKTTHLGQHRASPEMV